MAAKSLLMASAVALLMLQGQAPAAAQKRNEVETAVDVGESQKLQVDLPDPAVPEIDEQYATAPALELEDADPPHFIQSPSTYGPPQPCGPPVACGSDIVCIEGGPCAVPCMPPPCPPIRWQAYGDYLYLRPGGDKIAYAVPINGAIVPPLGAPPVQVGREARVDCGFDSGFRTAISRALNPCADVGVTYTHFGADEADEVAIDVPYVLRSLVNHPGTTVAPTDFLDAEASYDLGFDLGDVDYRRILFCDDLFALQYLLGIRFAHLQQDFHSQFTNVDTIENVGSTVDFDGGGIRIGLEAKRHSRRSCLLLYGRGVASLLGGEFRGQYTQSDNLRELVVVTGWREDRVVPILDLELGVGWASPSGRMRFTAGYLFSGWYNVVQADGFIDAVRSNNSVTVGDTLTFDGMMIRTEMRF